MENNEFNPDEYESKLDKLEKNNPILFHLYKLSVLSIVIFWLTLLNGSFSFSFIVTGIFIVGYSIIQYLFHITKNE